ncbi:MAG: hypothetical protein PWR03_834 [Tenuifilum sp.]|uniref:hypothetical protein n=1 Tax=Tenuifilum sp. TaxID=2760880 RepID=UPI0024AC5035|nr:hypothetical protein [Tenuifilum sp.]MDI3526651.1 hypothetical protein [Tenuifilum sp.]
MNKGSRFIILVSVFALAVVTVSCKCNREPDDMLNVNPEDVKSDEELISSIESVKQIFYSLPSPLETAMILKRSGASYNEELLNSIESVSKYNTTKSMALNLGIYSTDLSYASLFDQTQATIKYMTASKKMAEGLGILNAIDNSVIEKLEENINNRDVILETISETFLNTNSILQEDDRVAVGSMILVGGWVEGLYIATSLVDDVNKVDNEMVDRIIDQKLSLGTVLKLLEQSISNADVKELYDDMLELQKVYNDIKIEVKDVKVVNSGESNVSTIKSNNVTSISPKSFENLKTKVKELRNKYTV